MTGPDLARLLVDKTQTPQSFYPLRTAFIRGNSNSAKDYSEGFQQSDARKDERKIDPKSLQRMTNFLMGGHVDVGETFSTFLIIVLNLGGNRKCDTRWFAVRRTISSPSNVS